MATSTDNKISVKRVFTVLLLLMSSTAADNLVPRTQANLTVRHYRGHQASGHYVTPGVVRKRLRCPRQVKCQLPGQHLNPCCFGPPGPRPPLPLPTFPPYPPLPYPTWIPTYPPTYPPPTYPPPTYPPTYPPPTYPPPTYPPTYPPPTYPPTYPPPTYPPTYPPPTYPPTYPPPTYPPTYPPPTYPPTNPPPTFMPTNEPNSSSTTFPPSTHPTIPTVTPVYYPPPWCGMYGQCGCPQVTTPPACPYLAYGTGARRVRSIAQRACSLNGQCPAGSSCCTHACYRSKVCTPTITTPTPRPRKVKVSVMMTSASSDCSVFIKEHLIPFTAALQNHLQIELIPYGKVGKDGGCQYGYGDCLGNWLVSCGGRHLTGGESAQLAFAACLTQHTHILSTSNFTAIMAAAVQCTVDQPARVERMYQCAVSVEGLNLFQEAGRRQRQLTPALTQVPTIALDGVVVIRLAHDVKAFPKLLCDRLRQVAGAHQLCLATQSKLLLSTPSHR